MQDSPYKDPPDVGAPFGSRDASETLPIASGGVLEVDASLVFDKMGKLCERVTFVNFIRRSRMIPIFGFF